MGFKGLESDPNASYGIPRTGSQRATINHSNALFIIEPKDPLHSSGSGGILAMERFRVRQEVMTMNCAKCGIEIPGLMFTVSNVFCDECLADIENQERNEQAIADGEARYRQSVLGDEVA